MANAKLQYRSDGFVTIRNIGGVITVEGPTYRSRKWAVKQLKKEAKEQGIKLWKHDGVFLAGNHSIAVIENQLLPALARYWVSPKVSELKGKILDYGY